MDNWQGNIDPRLLDQNVAQVGGFIGDEKSTENRETLAQLEKGPYTEYLDIDMDLDPEHIMTDLNADLPEVWGHPAPTAQMTPYASQDPPTASLSFSDHGAWNTPPTSLRADADVFHPAPSWQNNNPFALLAEHDQLPTHYQTPHSGIRRGGLLTPDTMSTGHRSRIHHERLLSPTHRGTRQPYTVDTRDDLDQERPPMSINMNGVPANMPAAENIESWAGGSYSVPAVPDTTHLGPHTASRPGRGSRATSVVSTTGQGTFVCVGAPGKPCGKRFPTRSAMTHHARCHKPDRHFCSICGSGWYYKKDLKRHMKKHAPRDRHLICNNIGCKYHTTPFSRQDHLQRHALSCRHSQQ